MQPNLPLVKKGDECYMSTIEERKARAHQKNSALVEQVRNFREDKQKEEEEKLTKLSLNILKHEEKVVC